MKAYLHAMAEAIHKAVAPNTRLLRASTGRDSSGGDRQFLIDELAEKAVRQFVQQADLSVSLISEDGVLEHFGTAPEYLLVVDPIDGTRPTAAGIDGGMVSIACAPVGADLTIGDVSHGLLLELNNGRTLYASKERPGVESTGYAYALPAKAATSEISEMFWSIEFNGHPANLMADAYGHLIDASANTGAVFVVSSASFSISRIITGQFDAYVDIGNRLYRDHPEMKADFLRVGRGKVLHLFPYDIAAAVLVAKQAGIVVTDAYGKSLDTTLLTDFSTTNQQSCVAAATPALHEQILRSIKW